MFKDHRNINKEAPEFKLNAEDLTTEFQFSGITRGATRRCPGNNSSSSNNSNKDINQIPKSKASLSPLSPAPPTLAPTLSRVKALKGQFGKTSWLITHSKHDF